VVLSGADQLLQGWILHSVDQPVLTLDGTTLHKDQAL
jgi:hypothetical protein